MEPELVLPGAIQQSPRTAREDTARLVAAKLIQGIARRKWWTVSPSVRRQRHLFNACTLNLVEKVQEICGNSPSLVTDVEHETVSLRLRRTPLHIASACGSTAVVSYLIEKGADLQAKDANGLTPLHYAAQDSLDYFTQYSSVICLHEDKHEKQTAWKRRYTKVGDGGQFADCATLICKTHYRRYKRAAFIEGLLEVRCDQAQQTALHKAAACGKTAVLEVLIRFGANVSVSDSLDRSSLHLAAWVGSDEAISLLLKAKGDPLAVNRVGRTALHVAATYGHNASVKLLLEAGAPINAINYNNNTALHLALLDDFESTAEVLVRAGAETYTPNVFGETPLLIAVEKFPRLASIMLDNCVSVHNQSVLTHSKTMKYCFSGLDLPASVRFGVVKRQSNVLALVRQALGENNMVRGNCSHSEAMPPGLQPLTAISPVSPVASPCDSTPEPTLDPNINSAWLPHYGRVHICSELAASSQSLLRSKPLGSPRNAACGFPGNSASPLEVMVARGQRQMVSHPVIRHLLECKWDAFGKRALFLDAALHLLLTLLWLCATVAFGESCETAGFRYNVSERGACGGLHLFSMLGVFACFVAMLMTEVVHKTWQSWSLSNFWSLYDPAAALVGLVLGMFCLVVNQTEQGDDWRNTHRVMFAVVSLLIWFRWLQYLGALRFTGPFIKVMSRLTRDTGVFVCVYVVFLLGFAHTFYLLLHDTFGDTNPIEFESFPQSLLTTFLILAGTFSFDLLRTSSLDFPATLLCASCVCVPVTCGRYIAYVLLVSIAMINLLIALFFDSYDKVKLSTEQEWRLGWAQRILKLQRRRMSAALNIEEDMIVHEDVYDESETKQEEIEAMAADLSSFKDDVTASLTGLQAQMGELSATVARLADGLDANRTEK